MHCRQKNNSNQWVWLTKENDANQCQPRPTTTEPYLHEEQNTILLTECLETMTERGERIFAVKEKNNNQRSTFQPRGCKYNVFHCIDVESTMLFGSFTREPGGRHLAQWITDIFSDVTNMKDDLCIQECCSKRFVSKMNQSGSAPTNEAANERQSLPVDRGTSSAKLSTWARSSPSTKCNTPVEPVRVAFGNSVSIRARDDPGRWSAWTIHPFPSKSSTILSPTNPVAPVTNATRGCVFVAILRFDISAPSSTTHKSSSCKTTTTSTKTFFLFFFFLSSGVLTALRVSESNRQ